MFGEENIRECPICEGLDLVQLQNCVARDNNMLI